MSAHMRKQFDPSDAWHLAERLLQTHGRSPDGAELSSALVRLLMVGVWVGCRLALLDRDVALGIAAVGNTEPGRVFESLRRGLAREYSQAVTDLVHDTLYARGFTNAWTELVPHAEPPPQPLNGADVLAAAEELLDSLRRPRTDAERGEGQS